MELWPPHLYRSNGRALGVPDPVLQEALRQAHEMQGRGLPAILTLRHLAVRTETPYEDLRSYVERKDDPYRVFQISKRSGGKRRICVPANSLLRAQRWLARHLLNRVAPHHASTAYAPGASPLQCARMHCGCTWLLKVDVRSFFESISEIQVYRVFEDLGYNPLISFEMARLCTRVPKRDKPGMSRRQRNPVWQARNLGQHAIHSYECREIGHLPQGAPTSPMLSNLAMRDLDKSLAELAAGTDLVYTRYADDLSFSTADSAFTRANAVHFLKSVHAELLARGLKPNREKTTIAPPGARKVVLGLLVDGTQPRLRREFKQKLLSHAHFLRRYGVTQHAEKRGFHSVWSMRRHLQGLISYARQIEPLFAEQAEREFARVDWGPLELAAES